MLCLSSRQDQPACFCKPDILPFTYVNSSIICSLCLLLPGKSSKTELAKLIVAQDLFGLWGDDLTVACTAALIGAQKWAGDDVAPVSLLVYLRDSVPAVQPLMVRSCNSSYLVYMFGTLSAL